MHIMSMDSRIVDISRIYNILKAVGSKRILFGSDSPVVSPIQLEIDKILTLPISNEEKQDILYNNVNTLLEFCQN